MAEVAKQQSEVEVRFRKILEEVADLAKALSPVCEKSVDLVGMCELALENEGQLRLLLKQITKR